MGLLGHSPQFCHRQTTENFGNFQPGAALNEKLHLVLLGQIFCLQFLIWTIALENLIRAVKTEFLLGRTELLPRFIFQGSRTSS